MSNEQDLSWKELELENKSLPTEKRPKETKPRRGVGTISKTGIALVLVALVLCAVTVVLFVKMSGLKADVTGMEERLSDLTKNNERLKLELSDVKARLEQLKSHQREREAAQAAALQKTPTQAPMETKKPQPKKQQVKPRQTPSGTRN